MIAHPGSNGDRGLPMTPCVTDNPWAVPPPPTPPPGWTQPPSSSRGRIVAIIGIAVFALLAGLFVVAAQLPQQNRKQSDPAAYELPSTTLKSEGDPSAVTAKSTVRPTTGTVIFSDDFTDPTTGWNIGGHDDSDNEYDSAGYTITVTKPWMVSTPSPYDGVVSQLSQSVTSSISASSEEGSSFGLACGRDFDAPSEMDYEFFVDREGGWYIQRRNKATDFSSNPHVLSEGAVPQRTTKPITMVAVCASLADGKTTRLVLFIGGVEAADLTDRSPAETSNWQGMLDTEGGDTKPTSVLITGYSESRLGPVAADTASAPGAYRA
jgi:hypothetical protein